MLNIEGMIILTSCCAMTRIGRYAAAWPSQTKEPQTMPAMTEIRPAERTDVVVIAEMFAQDTLGGHGDSADPADLPLYLAAFDRISASPNETLYVAVIESEVVGTFQTTLITSLTAKGSANLTVGAIHTRVDRRGERIGEAMVRHAIEEGRARGARLVQLMTNADRTDAHRFYERLGFSPSHVGYKMKLR
jgi:GNAT superfamily N-acetyltransferase